MRAAADLRDAVAARYLSRFAGTYDYDALINEPEIHNAIQALLGSEFDHFVANMSGPRVPIDVVGGALMVLGGRTDLPSREQAVLCITLHPLQVHVAIYSNNAMTLYSPQREYRHLPQALLQWVHSETTVASAIDQPPRQGGSEFTFEFKTVQGKPGGSDSAPAASASASQASAPLER